MHTITFNGHSEHYSCSEDAYNRFAEIVEEAIFDTGLTFCKYQHNNNPVVSWKLV